MTYKWPEWLTQQTQKQRIIWGYKILFLDVLFPLNVKKVNRIIIVVIIFLNYSGLFVFYCGQYPGYLRGC